MNQPPQPGDSLTDFELPDQNGRARRLSSYTRPGEMDERLGFTQGYPLIVVFYRGFFCPRDQRQMRGLVEFQDELSVSYCKLVSVAVQPPLVQAAFRAGLGANWPFLCDEGREVIRPLGLLDETEGEYAEVARPFTYILNPDLTIHAAYDGWYFVGRPTAAELRAELRAAMSQLAYYPYAAWNTPEVKAIRIPQAEWADGAPELGANGLWVGDGVVAAFDLGSGNGFIQPDDGTTPIFFNFTAIPGAGYRTLRPGTRVRFEIVETATGRTARNIQAST
jgi:cold shock CspA family protein/peroxiredoxin